MFNHPFILFWNANVENTKLLNGGLWAIQSYIFLNTYSSEIIQYIKMNLCIFYTILSWRKENSHELPFQIWIQIFLFQTDRKISKIYDYLAINKKKTTETFQSTLKVIYMPVHCHLLFWNEIQSQKRITFWPKGTMAWPCLAPS